ncbi:cation diffusion facilitator family transporter [Aliagarivorans marinus]|uniref:cation diffusion facilitator family transporter n=1 Tax=Aliagarivorans marinus TaxID=561965 RepID=UPI000406866A|nr:cation diffusion facilitator family transporter [Aliagarivorans marinus]
MGSSQYKRLVTIATWTATLVATLLLIIKSIAVFYTGSVSILASMIDSLMDIGMSVVNLLAVRYALQPPDSEHRFGHGKAEHLAGLAQAAFISGSGLMLIYTGANSIHRQAPLEGDSLGLWVMLVSTALTVALVGFQRYVVRRTNNSVIKADSLHYVMDILMNAAVLLALLLTHYGWFWADGVFAIIIALYIMVEALKIGREAVQNLLDRELPEDEQATVRSVSMAVDGVLGVHDLRTRQSGATRFIQLHIELADELSLYQSHQIADLVEEAIQQQWQDVDVIVHQDPRSVVSSEQKQQFD